MNIILFLIIGAVAGWLAGKFMKGKGFGLVGNLVVGHFFMPDFSHISKFYNYSFSQRREGMNLRFEIVI